MAAVRSRDGGGPDLTTLLRREPVRSQIADQLSRLPAFHTEGKLTEELSDLMDELARECEQESPRARGQAARRR